MSNGFESDKKWGEMLNKYQYEKTNGQQTMTNWKKCYDENMRLKHYLTLKSKQRVNGFNPVRDRFNSPERDQKYYQNRVTTFFSKAKSRQAKGEWIEYAPIIHILLNPFLFFFD